MGANVKTGFWAEKLAHLAFIRDLSFRFFSEPTLRYLMSAFSSMSGNSSLDTVGPVSENGSMVVCVLTFHFTLSFARVTLQRCTNWVKLKELNSRQSKGPRNVMRKRSQRAWLTLGSTKQNCAVIGRRPVVAVFSPLFSNMCQQAPARMNIPAAMHMASLKRGQCTKTIMSCLHWDTSVASCCLQ